MKCSEDFQMKVTRALHVLERTGMSKSSYLPPMYPLYWKLGLEVPPPHFMSFFGVTLVAGLPLGLCVLGVCLMNHEHSQATPVEVLLLSAVTTFVWGAVVATYYRMGKERHRLPSWNKI